MQDVAYARRLFAILTKPHPTGVDPDDPYGQVDDGINRYDGFGRDVWVESLEVAEGERDTPRSSHTRWGSLPVSMSNDTGGAPWTR